MIALPLTSEQEALATHTSGAFVEACPGAGKTRAIIGRVSRLASTLPPRKGLAVISFTNAAVEEFIARCHMHGISGLLQHPSFVGTFDSFLRQFFIIPCGLAGVDAPPTVVDSWNSLAIEIRLRKPKNLAGPGVPLDQFDAATNAVNPERIGNAHLRNHVVAYRDAYEKEAERRRRHLRQRGYVSAADGRCEVIRRLDDPTWASALGATLAARFQEIIVDEAQDCNPLDLRILTWLREHGAAVTVVADPDQAIYGFRHEDPTRLRDFASTYEDENRLRLTGNYRSSPSICALAATLRCRTEPDHSSGDTATSHVPVHILPFTGNVIPREIGQGFAHLLQANGIISKDAIILAHRRRVAQRAAGLSWASDSGGNSKVSRMVRAVVSYWALSGTNSNRENALRSVERMILELMGKIDDCETPERAMERHEINSRWLRRTALAIVSRVPRSCEDDDGARSAWIARLWEEVRAQRLPYCEGMSEKMYFRKPPKANWSTQLTGIGGSEIQSATIHEVKGREYDAVCLVIPPDRSGSRSTARLCEAWDSRVNEEAKRVVYVGVTRARKLVALAIPTNWCDTLLGILERNGVLHKVVRIGD